jgi:hypothetical protein
VSVRWHSNGGGGVWRPTVGSSVSYSTIGGGGQRVRHDKPKEGKGLGQSSPR